MPRHHVYSFYSLFSLFPSFSQLSERRQGGEGGCRDQRGVFWICLEDGEGEEDGDGQEPRRDEKQRPRQIVAQEASTEAPQETTK